MLPLEGPDLSRGGQSVHHRHLHVHEDQVETSTPEGLERLAPIRHADKFGAGSRQQNLDDLAVGGMIVRQQNPERYSRFLVVRDRHLAGLAGVDRGQGYLEPEP